MDTTDARPHEQSSEDHDRPSGATSRRARRIGWTVALVGLVAVAGAGWWVGASTQSPQQAAARASEPTPSWVTAPVEYRMLSSTLVKRGDVQPESTLVVQVPASIEGTPVITQTLLVAGEAVTNGARVVEVSGRPVFVFESDVALYRTLAPGMEGDDVTAVQHSLIDLGYAIDPTGEFDEATKSAVASFYRDAGYQAVPTSATVQADISAAERAIADAEADLESARNDLSSATNGPLGSDIAVADAALASARRTLDDAIASRDEAIAVAEAAVDVARSDLARAQRGPTDTEIASADAVVASAQRTLADAEATRIEQVNRATTDVEIAEAARTETHARNDLTSEEWNAANVAVDVARVVLADTDRDTAAAVASAREQLNIARLARTELKSEPTITATANVTTAEAALASTQRNMNNAVTTAREQLEIAELARTELGQTRQTAELEQALTSAQSRVDSAIEAAAELARTSGPTIPQGEFVFVTSTPARVLSAATTITPSDNDVAAGVVTLASGRLVIDTTVTPDEIDLVRPGLTVELLDETTDTTYQATISSVADQTAQIDGGQIGHLVHIEPTNALPDWLSGSNLRITLTTATTDTENLVVPLAAVTSAADGTTRVSVVDNMGNVVDVPVSVGLSADGFVAIEPIDSDALSPNDEVVVGQ